MGDTIKILQDNLGLAMKDTFFMVFFSTVIGVVIGGLIGFILFLTSNPLLFPRPFINRIVGFIVNAIRSLPFLILMVVLIPLTAVLTNDPYSPKGAMISLAIAAIPFFARIAESSFSEIDQGIIEASLSTGAGIGLIFKDVLLPESLPSLIRGIVLTIISLIGYSAMVGTIGAGGIGDLAIQYGYNRYETGVLIFIVALLIVLIQIIQWLGDWIARRATK